MSDANRIKGMERSGRRTKAAKGAFGWMGRAAIIGAAFVAGAGVWIYSALADAPPVLTIAPLGSNQFLLISITNASASSTNELYHAPVLNDVVYPWTLSVTGALGQSNFIVSMGVEPTGFWRAAEGGDWDSDGIPNWLDADPNNAAIGVLSVTITSPGNGANID